MKILITGAAGQLGSEIISVCKNRSIDFVAMTREDADISDSQLVDKFILKHEPTHIIHSAAWTSVDMCEHMPEKAMRINSEGTKNIVSAAKMVNAHVTYISTDYVFDGEKSSPYLENDAVNPLSVYGMTKLMGEKSTRNSDAIVRVSWVCGEVGSNVVKTVLRIAKETDELFFVDDQFGTPTFAEDAANRIVDISSNNESGIWHVSNSGVTNWHEFVETILRVAGIENVKVNAISSEELEPKRPAHRPKYSALETNRENNKLDRWEIPLEKLIKKLTSS